MQNQITNNVMIGSNGAMINLNTDEYTENWELDDGTGIPPETLDDDDRKLPKICQFSDNGLCAEEPTHFMLFENDEAEKADKNADENANEKSDSFGDFSKMAANQSTNTTQYNYCERHYAYTLATTMENIRGCDCPVGCNRSLVGYGSLTGKKWVVKPTPQKQQILDEWDADNNERQLA
jgi:hypothetical protein